MAIRIDKKIVDYRVGGKDEPQQEPAAARRAGRQCGPAA